MGISVVIGSLVLRRIRTLITVICVCRVIRIVFKLQIIVKEDLRIVPMLARSDDLRTSPVLEIDLDDIPVVAHCIFKCLHYLFVDPAKLWPAPCVQFDNTCNDIDRRQEHCHKQHKYHHKRLIVPLAP